MPQKPNYNMPVVNKNIGENIARIRKAKGLSQIELAEKIGFNKKLLSHYENGRLHISAEMAINLAKVLDVSTDELLDLKDLPIPNNQLGLRFTRRIRELNNLPEKKKKVVLQVLDDLIRANL